MFSAESSTHAVAGAHETGGIIIMYSQIVVRSPWRRKWQSPAVFLPGESLGQRSLAGYSSWGRKESDMTEPLSITQQKLSINLKLNYDLILLNDLCEE